MVPVLLLWLLQLGLSPPSTAPANIDRPPALTFDKHVDYIAWYNAFVSQGRPTCENAYDLYYKISPLEGNDRIDPLLDEASACLHKPWDAETNQATIAYLDRNQRFLTYFRQGATRTSLWQLHPPQAETLLDVLSPIPGACRMAARALVVQSWMRVDDQASRTLDNWGTILNCARQLIEDAPLTSTNTGRMLIELVCLQSRLALREGIISGTAINRTISLIGGIEPRQVGMRRSVIHAWGAALDAIQFSAPNGRFEEARLSSVFPEPERYRSLTTPMELRDCADRDYARFMAVTDGPVGLSTLRMARKLEPPSGDAVIKHGPYSFSFPSLLRAYEISLRTQACRRGTLLVLALHAHRQEHKQWPSGLDQLPIDSLKALRIDPYSETDFVYKLTDNGPLLYSIASDGKDDGGRHDPGWGEGPDGGDFVFWPVCDR